MLFINFGYHGDDLAPSLTIHKDGADSFEYVNPRGQILTLTFEPGNRRCTGWHDLATSQSYPCPNTAKLEPQFETCRHCQQKTGFNPAFYHALSVSPQQQTRNAQPHVLYLAHFAPGMVKVGISWAQRGIRRLLDQGARSCLIIKTYPTATLARQYEAKAAALPGIAETLQAKSKYKYLARPYDSIAAAQELLTARDHLAAQTGVTPDNNQPQYLDRYYIGSETLCDPIILKGEQKISGRCLGMIGGLLICEQAGRQFGLPLHSFTGYRARIDSREEANNYAPQQASLF